MKPARFALPFLACLAGCSLMVDLDQLSDRAPAGGGGGVVDAGPADDQRDSGAADGGRPRTCPVSELPRGFCDDFDDDAPLEDRWDKSNVEVPPIKLDQQLSIQMPVVAGSLLTRSYVSKRLAEPLGPKVTISSRVRVVGVPAESSAIQINAFVVQDLTYTLILRSDGTTRLQVSDSSTTRISRTIAPWPMNEWWLLTFVIDRSTPTTELTILFGGRPVTTATIDDAGDAGANQAIFNAGISTSRPTSSGEWGVQIDDFRVEGAP